MNVKEIGAKIYDCRKELKLTLQEVADAIGVTKSTVQRYEAGKITTPKLPVIEAIARVLMVNPSWLIGKSEKKEASSYTTYVAKERVSLLTVGPDGNFVYDKNGSFKLDTPCDFCIRMSGDSMIGARIYDGDIIFVKSQPDVEDGEIAAIMYRDIITVKRIFKIGDKIHLRSENPAFQPITLDKKEIRILGKAVSFQSNL